MLDPAGYSALGDIYDAAINPGRWRRALDGVAAAVDAKAVALLIRQPGSAARDKQMLSSAYLDFMKTPWGLYYATCLGRLQDPDWDFLSLQTPHHPVPDTQISGDPAGLDARKDYRLLRKRVGVRRRMGVRLNDDKLWFDAMSLGFPDRLHSIPAQAQKRILPILPHVTKAAQIGRTFAALKARYRAVLSALDHVGVGLAIADAKGQIIVQNSELDRILDLQDGLSLQAGALAPQNADIRAELAEAVARTGRTASGEDDVAEHLVAVLRPSGREAFLLDVAPLRESDGTDLGEALEGALITVIDPARMPDLKIDRFVALYGLTASESEVCALLLKGIAQDDIAQIRGTSPVTVKNQIAAILAKTGVARRSELVRLVLRVLPPV